MMIAVNIDEAHKCLHSFSAIAWLAADVKIHDLVMTF